MFRAASGLVYIGRFFSLVKQYPDGLKLELKICLKELNACFNFPRSSFELGLLFFAQSVSMDKRMIAHRCYLTPVLVYT